MSKLLQGLKQQLRNSAIEISSELIKDNELTSEELVGMFSNIAQSVSRTNDCDSIKDIIELVEQDVFGILGYCSEGLDDLFEDADRIITWKHNQLKIIN
ncbi:hypothetical protein Phi19:2_gp005 [Cellulophaga phage phi19:2]|uniref:Uncharacterized protein n=2 Tax=Cellulophaga phage phiST TaxID=756282 RepID=M4T1W3_9CAUD|nr:hypothetical protein CGPG_00101 [Cellulophaga phage phiST]AGH56799.1 hypothetical protein CGPG_00101 [Cellulophaga phage phiST]AGO47144.1 hypothetical protein PhiST_gp005 [Cellulophaga phage phiST]AGO48640.1 hypothetical protein Phi19:2_gp005 [Cellulophaga phage phi19:2]